MTKYCKHCSHGKSYHTTRVDLVVRDNGKNLIIRKMKKEICLACKNMKLAEDMSGQIGYGNPFLWSSEIVPFHKYRGESV